MNLKKVMISLLLVVALSVLSVAPAFAAARIKDGDSFTWEYEDEVLSCKDAYGKPVRGFVSKGDDVYYLNKDGIVKTGWVKYLGDWYYFYSDTDDVEEKLIGTMAKDEWIDNYYVNSKGIMTKTR